MDARSQKDISPSPKPNPLLSVPLQTHRKDVKTRSGLLEGKDNDECHYPRKTVRNQRVEFG